MNPGASERISSENSHIPDCTLHEFSLIKKKIDEASSSRLSSCKSEATGHGMQPLPTSAINHVFKWQPRRLEAF